ncbi:MAG: hypothetical protein R8P61_01430 [Bacteroidia bacterium]|nr:hypothetical protein [Bacteroidia bacterium]
MTHYRMLVCLLALALGSFSAFAQSNATALLFSPDYAKPDTSEYPDLFYAQNAYNLKAGLGYVRNGDFRFCLGGGYQVPIGNRTAKNKQLVGGIDAALHYTGFSNESFSSNVTQVTVSPHIDRVCNFSENVDMRAGLSLPIGFGRSSSEFDGQTSNKDNLLNVGVNFDVGVAYRLKNGSFISAETSLAGIGWNRRTSVDNPDISVSDSNFWLGLNKNNAVSFAYNMPIGGDNMRR